MIDRLISADSHVVPLPSFWREYLPAQLRDRAPRIESTDEGDFSVFEGRRAPVMAINSIAGKSRDGQGFSYRRFTEQLAGGHDPAARIADQERDGIAAEVLYGGGPLVTEDRELFLASHLAYNHWLADYCAHAPERLLGLALLVCSVAASFDGSGGALAVNGPPLLFIGALVVLRIGVLMSERYLCSAWYIHAVSELR